MHHDPVIEDQRQANNSSALGEKETLPLADHCFEISMTVIGDSSAWSIFYCLHSVGRCDREVVSVGHTPV